MTAPEQTLAENPRYAAYARSCGLSAEACRERDRERLNTPEYRGGFLFWIRDHIQQFRKVNPKAFMFDIHLIDHDGFDNWLNEKYPL